MIRPRASLTALATRGLARRRTGVAKPIREYLVPVQTVDIDDYETVAEIFNRVNTGVLGSARATW